MSQTSFGGEFFTPHWGEESPGNWYLWLSGPRPWLTLALGWTSLLLLVFLLFVFLWVGVLARRTVPLVCRTPPCQALDRAVTGVLRSELEPCDNFYAYVCPERPGKPTVNALLQVGLHPGSYKVSEITHTRKR